MKFLSFLKQQWNIIAALSLSIVVLLTKVVVPPNIDLDESVGPMDKIMLARLVVMIALLLTLFPLSIYKKKQHGWFWWIASLVVLGASVFLFLKYLGFTDRHTGFNVDSGQRQVTGDHLIADARPVVDSLKHAFKLDSITLDLMVVKMGNPRFYFPAQEITKNSEHLLALFAATIFFAALFIILSIQAAYCSTSKK